MFHRIIQAVVLSVTALSSHLVLAEENILEPVIVTATRTAQTADQALASVTVISREEIEKTQAKSLADLLKNKAGIHVTQSGGYGKSTSVFIRGSQSDHVLVLVDGMRAASSTLGTYSWENFLPEQIERIEIVRGPRASLYGSDAIGGVIQIFTRHSTQAHISVSINENTNQFETGFGGGENWKYSVEAGRLDTDGIPTLVNSTDAVGYDNSHLALALTGKIIKEGDVKFRLSESMGTSRLDPTTGDIDFKNRVFSSEYNLYLTDNWSQKFSFGNTLDESQSHSPYVPSTITTKRNSGAWQNDIFFGEDILTLGIDYYADHATKDDSGIIDEKINNKAVFIQQQIKLFNNDWLIGGRYDKHSEFGKHTTWNIAWGYDVSSTARLTASYGKAFKAPTINDLFWPQSTDAFFGTTYISSGNASLLPEESNSAEIGLQQKISTTASFGVNVFHTKISELIDWVTAQTGVNEYTTTPSNTNKVTINGVELVFNWMMGEWQLNSAVTMLDAKDDDRDQQLDRRPEQTLSVTGSRSYQKHDFYAELIAASGSLENNGTKELAGYGLTNLSYQLRVDENLTLGARVDNLFNKEYVLASGYTGDWNVQDRSVFVSMLYKF